MINFKKLDPSVLIVRASFPYSNDAINNIQV